MVRTRANLLAIVVHISSGMLVGNKQISFSDELSARYRLLSDEGMKFAGDPGK